MDLPRIGVSLPHFGPHAGPEAVVTVARATERLGFHAVSVTERLLTPAGPDWTNEMHITLNLASVHPDKQVEHLESLAAKGTL